MTENYDPELDYPEPLNEHWLPKELLLSEEERAALERQQQMERLRKLSPHTADEEEATASAPAAAAVERPDYSSSPNIPEDEFTAPGSYFDLRNTTLLIQKYPDAKYFYEVIPGKRPEQPRQLRLHRIEYPDGTEDIRTHQAEVARSRQEHVAIEKAIAEGDVNIFSHGTPLSPEQREALLANRDAALKVEVGKKAEVQLQKLHELRQAQIQRERADQQLDDLRPSVPEDAPKSEGFLGIFKKRK